MGRSEIGLRGAGHRDGVIPTDTHQTLHGMPDVVYENHRLPGFPVASDFGGTCSGGALPLLVMFEDGDGAA
jgi:hypothetical protein